MNEDKDRNNFEELVPFYVNGTLSENDMRWMKAYLERFPELQTHIKFTESIKSALQAECHSYNPEQGWNKLLEKYKALQLKKSKFSVIKDFFNQLNYRPAFAIAFTLLILQSALLMPLVFQDDEKNYREFGGDNLQQVHLKITINPTTDFSELVTLLRKNGCSIVSGPSDTGELWIRLDEPTNAAKTKQDLLNSSLIDEVISVSEIK